MSQIPPEAASAKAAALELWVKMAVTSKYLSAWFASEALGI
jgi:hypothetical protein